MHNKQALASQIISRLLASLASLLADILWIDTARFAPRFLPCVRSATLVQQPALRVHLLLVFTLSPPLTAPATRGDFLPSDFSGAPTSCAQPSLLPSIPGFFPSRLHATPNLNPIFHITSRKSYPVAGQEAVRRTKEGSRTRERRNIFIFSLPLSTAGPLSPPPPPPSAPRCRPK